MDKKRPLVSWTPKIRPRQDPKFQKMLKLGGVGRWVRLCTTDFIIVPVNRFILRACCLTFMSHIAFIAVYKYPNLNLLISSSCFLIRCIASSFWPIFSLCYFFLYTWGLDVLVLSCWHSLFQPLLLYGMCLALNIALLALLWLRLWSALYYIRYFTFLIFHSITLDTLTILALPRHF